MPNLAHARSDREPGSFPAVVLANALEAWKTHKTDPRGNKSTSKMLQRLKDSDGRAGRLTQRISR